MPLFLQALLNIWLKSTSGLAIGFMLCDMSGSLFCLLQMLLLSINNDDIGNFTGNPGKLGSGIVGFSYNLLFFIQRFVIYKDWKKPEEKKRGDYIALA